MDLPNWFVCLMGMGTVFISLIFLVIICSILGAICKSAEKRKAKKETDNSETVIENRGEFVAAVSAAIAEELGTDVTGIKIISIKKL